MGSPLPLSLPPVTHSWVPVVRTAHPLLHGPLHTNPESTPVKETGRDRDNGFKKPFRRDPSHIRLPSTPSAPTDPTLL